MTGTGYAQKVYILGKDDDSVNIDGSGMHVQEAFPQYISFRFRITDDENGSQLPDIPCSKVIIRNATDPTTPNVPVYISGIGANNMGNNSMFLRDDESTTILVDDANKIALHSANQQDVRIIIYPTSESEVDLSEHPNINLPYLDIIPPTFVSITPTDGATNVERDTTVEIVMDESIDPNTVTTTNLSISPAPPSPGTWTVGVDTLDDTKLFLNSESTLAASTLYTITLQNVADLSGNLLAAPVVKTFTTKAAPPPPDTTPPTITTKDPASGESNVSISKAPKIIFSEDIDAATITTSTVKLREVTTTNLVTCTVSLGADKKTVTMTPSTSLQYSFAYQIEVIGGSSGVKDLAGNPLASTQTWQFTTVAQTYTLKYNVSYTHDNKLGGSYSDWIGLKVVNSSSLMNNVTPRKITVQLKKIGSPTGNISCQIRSGPTTVVKTIGSTLSAASLTTSLVEYTFIESTNNTKLQSGYRLVIAFNGGDSSNYIIMRRNQSNPFDGLNTWEIEEDGAGGDDDNTTYDMGGKVYE